MLEELAGLSVVDLGSTGLLVIVVVMILTGKLVPRRVIDDERQERDFWRAAHTVSEETRRMQTEQIKDVLEGVRTTNAALRALPLPPKSAEDGVS